MGEPASSQRTAGVITHHVQLPEQPDQLFWTLLNKAREGGLDSSFDYWRPRDWPPMAGTHNDFKARLGVVSMRGVSRFAEFNPPQHLLIESVKPTWPFLSRMSWDLAPAGKVTRYTYRMEIDAATGFRWLARLMLRRYDKRIADDVKALATLF
jgi:hypothetical protein